METIKIKYFDKKMPRIEKISCGDWIDLRAAESVQIKKGETAMIPLGVAMKLPEGYEANVVPRSSTYKKFGMIQTNHYGVIDNSYCGDNDQWWMPVYGLADGEVFKYDRICQFRINKKQPEIQFEEVEFLEGKDRGGFGSTGTE